MDKAIITGSNGFVGAWLTEYLSSRNIKVFGIDLQEKCFHYSTAYYQVDILDSTALTALIAEIQPDYIFNLAAVTFLPDADRSPKIAMDTNFTGTMSILDAVKEHVPRARILLVGSSKEYSDSTTTDTISEDIHPDPVNFYGISKYFSEMIGRQYHRQFGIDVRCTRSFNHTGPGQSQRFVCSEWARKIAEIALGQSEPEISVGNTNVTIDFSDVRDVVAGYYQIIMNGRPGEIYNVCSGRGTSLHWILEYFIHKAGKTIKINYPAEKKRSGDSSTIGSYAKLHAHTGWAPLIPIDQSLDDIYSWWMNALTT